MRLNCIVLLLLLLLSGCASLPEAPGSGSEQLQTIEARYGKEVRERVQSWRYLIEAQKSQPAAAQLTTANDFFNRLVFEDDSVHWGQEDYCATPLETLAATAAIARISASASIWAIRDA